MITSKKIKRLKLLKKSIEIKQYALQAQLSDLDTAIARKSELVIIFKNYLHDYDDRVTQVTVSKFLNKQLFLNQIAKVLESERDLIKKMRQQFDELQQFYFENDRKITVIDEHMQNMIHVKEQTIQKKQDDLESESFKHKGFMDNPSRTKRES